MSCCRIRPYSFCSSFRGNREKLRASPAPFTKNSLAAGGFYDRICTGFPKLKREEKEEKPDASAEVKKIIETKKEEMKRRGKEEENWRSDASMQTKGRKVR